MVGQFSGPFGSSFTVVGSLRVLIYSGRVPSTPPRVPSGPRLDWSGPTPRLGFTKILQWGRGGGGTLSSRWDGSNIVVQTLLQTGYLPEQPQTSYAPKCAHCHMHTHTHKMIEMLLLLAPQENTTLRSKMCTAPHAHAQNDWKCRWRHKKTPRYDPKCAPRHTYTRKMIHYVAGATRKHHVTIQNVHRATRTRAK